MGWLTAVPCSEMEGTKGSRKKVYWPHNRRAQMEKEGTFENWMLEIPNRWSTIFQSFIDLGMYDLSGMGDFIPLSWQTLHAYASCTDALHEEWQFLAIRQMSTKYLEGMHSGVEPLSIPPWLRDEDGYCEPSISS